MLTRSYKLQQVLMEILLILHQIDIMISYVLIQQVHYTYLAEGVVRAINSWYI